jgi:hypothetical protein
MIREAMINLGLCKPKAADVIDKMIRSELSESELKYIRKLDLTIPITLNSKAPYGAEVVYHLNKGIYFLRVKLRESYSGSDLLPNNYFESEYPGVNYLFLNEYENEIKAVLLKYHNVVENSKKETKRKKLLDIKYARIDQEKRDNLSKIWKRI